MRQHTTRLAVASIALAATALGARPAAADDAFRHGHIREVEPGVTLQRATETSAEEAIRNLPFLPGDRVWTDAAGRTEFQFPEGTVVRLDSRSKLDYADHDESREERVVLRLWSGSLILRTRSRDSAIFDIETPGGLVEVAVPAVVRIDVEGGEIQLSVYEGEASLDTGRDRVHAGAGERTWSRWGGDPAEPEPFDRYAGDDFARWDSDLESREAWAANSARYLPEELSYYAPEFDTHGTWVYEQPVGYVWQPRVAVGWAPYSNGRWNWTSYGWTWIPYEPWGWAPHHYGRWGFSVSLGWYWTPGTVWGAGWVSWGIGGGYVGWCALGPWNRPVFPWPHHHRHHRGHAVPRSIGPGHRGHAVPRGSVGHGWSVVKRDDLGHRDLARRRVDPSGVGALRVAESVHERPDRTASALTRSAAIPSAARARPRAGAASRAARGASPVPSGTTGRGLTSSTGAVGRSRPGVGSSVTTGIAGAAARARSRSGGSAAASSRSRGGAATASPSAGVRGAARARPRGSVSGGSESSSASRGSGAAPWVGSSRSRSGATARPRSSTGPREENPIGSLFKSREGSGANHRARPRSTPGASPSSTSGSRSRGGPQGSVVSPGRSPSVPRGATTGRSRTESSRGSGISSPPRSRSGVSGFWNRSRSPDSGSSGVSSRPRSTPRSSGVTSRPRSTPRASGVTSSPRSSPRGSGVSSRPRSSPRGGGVSSRPRSAPRSSGVSSRPRSSPRSSGVSSRPRSGGSSSRGVSGRPSSSPRSSGRSRGGSARSRGRPH